MSAVLDFLKKDNNTLYPITLTNAVYDLGTGAKLSDTLTTMNTTLTEVKTKTDPITVATDKVTIDRIVQATKFVGPLQGNASTASKLSTARKITLSGSVTGEASFDGSANITIETTAAEHTHNYAGSATAGGAANSAVKLATARTINGTSFDGSANITTSKWGESRKITLSGGAAGSVDIDGSTNVTLTVSSLDATKVTGVLPLSAIPQGAQERVVPVADMDAMYALTTTDVQLGDVVRVLNDGNGHTVMYYVVDQTKLSSADGYLPFAAGVASSASTLSTARKINGTAFDGSKDITTSTWGTARNIIIGSATKSINGSANVTYTLDEIGVAAKDHTHNYAGSSTPGGAATSAVKLATARKITIGSSEKTFDGTADIAFTLGDLAGVTTAGLGVEVDDSNIPKVLAAD